MFDALKELKKEFCFFEESDEYDEEEIKIGKKFLDLLVGKIWI